MLQEITDGYNHELSVEGGGVNLASSPGYVVGEKKKQSGNEANVKYVELGWYTYFTVSHCLLSRWYSYCTDSETYKHL